MRLILAARLSQLQRNGQQGLGLDTQDKWGREWAERTIDPGTGQPHEIVGVAADTKSGTVAPWDRPNLRPWVTEPAKMAGYEGILAIKNDRLSRGDWADEARIRLWAEEHGKRLVIADGPQWPPRHEGDRWQWEALAMEARREWERIRERIGRTRVELRERGYLVGRPTFGYDSGGPLYRKTLVPSETGRTYVPLIYARCIAGASLIEIGKWLDAEGVPTVANCSRDENGQCRVHKRPFAAAGDAGEEAARCTAERKWRGSVVAGIIRSSTYKGQRVQGNVIMSCEPLVDAATWQAAQDALTGRPKRSYTKPRAARAMLATAVFCARCGSAMYRHALRTTWCYYRCHGSGPQPKGCGNMIRTADAEEAVDAIIRRDFAVRVRTLTVIPPDDHSTEKDLVRARVRALAARADEMSDVSYDRELAALRAERDRLADLPVTKAAVIETESDDTYADRWAATAEAERGPWLTRNGFRVYLDKGDGEVGVRVTRVAQPTR
jgi:site-specific DNA recombinase